MYIVEKASDAMREYRYYDKVKDTISLLMFTDLLQYHINIGANHHKPIRCVMICLFALVQCKCKIPFSRAYYHFNTIRHISIFSHFCYRPELMLLITILNYCLRCGVIIGQHSLSFAHISI